jgi:hypothetical protein
MGTFSASLRTIGDRRGLPATVRLDGDRITIEAGEHPIGEWSLGEVHLEATGNGYRMAAEGEQILLEIEDPEKFEIELRGRTVTARKRPRLGASKTKVERPQERPEAARPAPAQAKPAKPEKPVKIETAEGKPDAEAEPGKVMARLDGLIATAERRWGSLLPSWIFTRRMVAILATALVVTVIFPGIISTVLLLVGLVLVLAGAVVYTDSVMAAKWLPGRMTPMHVLIGGVAVVMVGVLVGVIA